MMTTHEICEVLRAIEQEQPVQFNAACGWADMSQASPQRACEFIAKNYTLRVKPVPRKPRERWQNSYIDGLDSSVWQSFKAAEQARDITRTFVECVHYREVVEE